MNEIIPREIIEQRIFFVRHQKVMVIYKKNLQPLKDMGVKVLKLN